MYLGVDWGVSLTFPGCIKWGGGGGLISAPVSSSGPLSAFDRPRPPLIVFSSVPPLEWAYSMNNKNINKKHKTQN